jgi:signal transduction histidine kinase
MDPTVAIPAHFTLEILGVVAGGLLLAWASFEMRWPAAFGGLAIGTAQALHAGSFVSNDDAAAIIVLRFVGAVLVAAGAYNVVRYREILFSALAVFTAGSLWGALAGGSPSDLSGGHFLVALGALAMSVWVWLASRPSVRLRVLTSFILVLGLAVIVTGGSVARVAAISTRDQEFDKLKPTAALVREQANTIGTAVATRAAEFSPIIAPQLTSPVALRALVLHDGEIAMAFDRSGKLLSGSTAASFAEPGLPSRPAFTTAANGAVSPSYALVGDAFDISGLSPVFRPGGERRPSDVIGVLAIVRRLTVQDVRELTRRVEEGTEVALIQSDTALSTFGTRLDVPVSEDRTVFRSIETGDGEWPAVVTPLADEIRVLIAVPSTRVVDATRTLVRSFLIALLASALLAVVVALWLSARITRPMLDLVEEGERLKTDFLASVSHELRTPLTPIRGYTEILRRGRVPARRATGYLDEIGQAAQRLERIVSLLVDVAALDAGRYNVTPQDTSPETLLGDAVKRWDHVARTHPIHVEVDGKLPDVKADPVAIGRVFDELLDNAVKFSPDGGAITLEAARAGDGVRFTVHDNGKGMDAGRLSALGEAFEQLDSGDTRRFGGLGLGLTYVRGVLRQHDSRLVVDSAPDDGTTCSFALPASMVTPMRRKQARGSARKASSQRAR